MSLLLKLVKGFVCRSNHHRVAVDALVHLRGTDGALWRNLFLFHHEAYLEGISAPDRVFKDFRNHVVYVREGNWGGAPSAAREWYRRTVRALAQQDWRHATYCAGVLSHYVLDPVHPFHTAQTEEEGVIHRAVDLSLDRSYDRLGLILQQDLGGYPDVPVPEGNDWLEQMVIAGARTANPAYETLVDHYAFTRAVRRPELGLDQEIRDTMARLQGYGTILVARILERAFVEAAVIPPKKRLAIATFLTAMSVPVNAAITAATGIRERAAIRAMYREFRKTGKVRDTLPEDDRMVRRLHTLEVLRIPMSAIDAAWPRESGTAHGTGTPPRATKRIRPQRAPKASAKAKAAPVAVEPTLELPASAVLAPTPAARAGNTTKVSPLAAAKEAAAREAVQPVAAPTATALQAQGRPRDNGCLSPDSPVEAAPSINPKTASRLTAIGVHTVNDLLNVSPEDAAARLRFRHINARVIRDWQAQAELASTIAGVDSIAAQLLVGAGIRDADDLAGSEADMLVNMLDEFCDTADGQRILRGATPPDEEQVDGWIEAARALLDEADDADEDEAGDGDEDGDDSGEEAEDGQVSADEDEDEDAEAA